MVHAARTVKEDTKPDTDTATILNQRTEDASVLEMVMRANLVVVTATVQLMVTGHNGLHTLLAPRPVVKDVNPEHVNVTHLNTEERNVSVLMQKNENVPSEDVHVSIFNVL